LGEELKIFRLTNKPKDCWPEKPDESTGPMHTQNQGKFQFIPTDANKTLREFIDRTQDPLALTKKLPEVQITDIWFVGRCHKYALTELLPGYIYQKEYDKDLFGTKNSVILDTYFTRISDPKPGDLTVYSDQNYRKHFGVYIAPDLVESKWGPGSVYRHPPFFVDSEYGNTITFYRLKPGAIFKPEPKREPKESKTDDSLTLEELFVKLNSND